MTDETPRRRPWYQFKIRMILAAVLALSLPLAWYTWEIEKTDRQTEIGGILEGAGCEVSYEEIEPTVPQKLRTFLGDPTVNRVVTAVLVNEQFIHPNGDVISAGWHDFGDDQATYFQELPHLKVLSLSNTQVSDAGLEHLQDLTGLKVLHLNNTRVTSEGVEKLKTTLPNCSVINY